MSRRAVAMSFLFFASTLVPIGDLRSGVCDGISDASGTPLTTVRIPGSYPRPVLVTAPPGDVSRIFIVMQDGPIQIIKNGSPLATPFLDLSGLTRSPADGGGFEQGLLGLAFHPGFATNGLFFVFYTDNSGANNVLVQYHRDANNPDLGDPASAQILLNVPHPTFTNHNGGMLAFAPDDGRLYLGTGDGGSGCDPSNNSQNPASLLGKLLRFDVDHSPITQETWARGLRNPWRFSFDPANSDLYIGDVGESLWEEVDYRPAPRSSGENYGWRVFEASQCPNPSCPGLEACDSIPPPVPTLLEYPHASNACSVTGGFVYRGCRMSNLQGRYFFGDFCGFVKSIRVVAGVATDPRDHSTEVGIGGAGINFVPSFGEDARGEIYILDLDGEVYKIVPILPNLQVSGIGATPFTPGAPDWSWEDLQATSDQPIATYRIYRTPGNGSGTFDCVLQSVTTTWAGGDPAVPALNSLYSYLVTATNSLGQETGPGNRSDGTPRTLSNLACPP